MIQRWDIHPDGWASLNLNLSFQICWLIFNHMLWGTVYAGSGMVQENPTRGLPVSNLVRSMFITHFTLDHELWWGNPASCSKVQLFQQLLLFILMSHEADLSLSCNIQWDLATHKCANKNIHIHIQTQTDLPKLPMPWFSPISKFESELLQTWPKSSSKSRQKHNWTLGPVQGSAKLTNSESSSNLTAWDSPKTHRIHKFGGDITSNY